MTYCLNPNCPVPENPDSGVKCRACGNPLILGGRYQPVKVLGQGGFGKTYLAKDQDNLGQPFVVIKQLRPLDQGGAATQKIQELFKGEAKQLQELGVHPQIPSLLAYYVLGDQFYMVQEFVNGGDLEKELRAGGRFSAAKLREFLREILPILTYVHEKGVIHRDLKPANIMRRKEDGKLVLIDFGVSKRLSSSLYTVHGTITGTRGFAPPEQLGDGNVRPASDLYSLGATCFQLLTQKHPHILVGGENWKTHLSAPLDARLVRVIDRLLQLEMNQRYQSATDVLKDLQPQGHTRRFFLNFGSNLGIGLLVAGATGALKLITDAVSRQSSPPSPKPTTPSTFSPNNSQPSSSTPSSPIGYILLVGAGTIGAVALKLITDAVSRQSLLKSSKPTSSSTPRPTASSTRAAESFTEELANGVSLEMLYIPAGSFQMGSPQREGEVSEHPQHLVKVPAFFMGKYAVTQGQYEAVMGNNPSYFKGDQNLPVEQVSWNDAVEFCRKLSAKSGNTYRLASEAEWEYACRAGTRTQYYFGDNKALLGDYAWYGSNSGDQIIDAEQIWNSYRDPQKYLDKLQNQNKCRTHPVGQKKPNAWGLYYMHGNVWEWCQDVWHDSYQGAPKDGSPWLDKKNNSSEHILRGGSWIFNPRLCRSAYRFLNSADSRSNDFFGFRVVYSSA